MKNASNSRSNRRNSNAVAPAPVNQDPRLAAMVACGMSEAQAAAILAAMTPAAAPVEVAPAPVEVAPAKERTPRTYEAAFLTGNFKKRLIASPCSDLASEYYAESKALCEAARAALAALKDPAPILAYVEALAVEVEKSPDFDAAAYIIDLCSKWEIPAPALRVVIQLAIPVITPCCDEVDLIARRAYGMPKANALMGSACNTLMYSKADPKIDNPLPFKRVCYNATSLGLAQPAADCIDDCDFVTDDSDFDELVALCDHWLKECKENAPAKAAPAPAPASKGRKRGASASEAQAAPVAQDPRLAALIACGMSEAQAKAILAALK